MAGGGEALIGNKLLFAQEFSPEFLFAGEDEFVFGGEKLFYSFAELFSQRNCFPLSRNRPVPFRARLLVFRIRFECIDHGVVPVVSWAATGALSPKMAI